MPLKGCYDIHAKGHLFVLGTLFMSRILTEAPQISGFLEISLRQWVHYRFRLPCRMEELFIVILTIFVNDVRNLPRVSRMDSWMQHPNHLNLFHHKLCPPRLTLLNQNSLNKNKIFQQLSLLLSSLVPRLSPPNGKQSLVALGG